MASARRQGAQATGHLVRPASPRAETLGVGLLMLLIAAAMAGRFVAVGSGGDGPALRPYQELASTLDPRSQTLHRTLAAAVVDVVDLRNLEGIWPETWLLEDQRVPPFDPTLVPPAVRGFTWAGYDGGSWVDYLGQDPGLDAHGGGGAARSFILRLIDLHAGYHPHPHPGIDYDPDLLVVAQVWVKDEAMAAYPGELLPEAGWRWVLGANDPLLDSQLTEQP